MSRPYAKRGRLRSAGAHRLGSVGTALRDDVGRTRHVRLLAGAVGTLRADIAIEPLHLAQKREPHPAVRRYAAVGARDALPSAREERDVDARAAAPVVVDAQRDDACLADLKPDRPDRRAGRVVTQVTPPRRRGCDGAIDEATLARDEHEVRARERAIGSRDVADDALDDDGPVGVLERESRPARIAVASCAPRFSRVARCGSSAEEPGWIEALRDDPARSRSGRIDQADSQSGRPRAVICRRAAISGDQERLAWVWSLLRERRRDLPQGAVEREQRDVVHVTGAVPAVARLW